MTSMFLPLAIDTYWYFLLFQFIDSEQTTALLPGNNGWSSLLKSNSIIYGNGKSFCNAMESDFESVTLINEINKERKRRGLSIIPAADDMCVTALFKGFTQKVRKARILATHFYPLGNPF